MSPVPAGRWPVPTLSLQSLRRRLDPYPAVSSRCNCPLLPWKRRPHATGNAFGTRNYPCKAVSTGSRISGLQSFDYLQAPTLARPPGCSHRNGSKSVGRPGRLHHASPRRLPALRCGIATCPTWATDMVGLPPTGLQPCRLLLPASGSRTRFILEACTMSQALAWPSDIASVAASRSSRALLDSSSIASIPCCSVRALEPGPLSSTGITRLQRYYEPLRHPLRPGARCVCWPS